MCALAGVDIFCTADIISLNPALPPHHACVEDLRMEWQVCGRNRGEHILFVLRWAGRPVKCMAFDSSPAPCQHLQPQPAVYKFATPLQHSGFEDFTVRFAW